MKSKNKFLVVCHDAGGAEVVSAFVKANRKKYNFFCYVSGPAKKIFRRKKIKLASSKIPKQHPDIDVLLTGTSWGSSLELEFIKKAKSKGIKTIAYLDHWVNYRQRFGYPKNGWKENLPDEIWVGDKYAYNIAKKSFGRASIKLVPNLYFEEIKKEYKKIERQTRPIPNSILFISEPLTAPVNCFGRKPKLRFSEYDVLDKLLTYLAMAGKEKRKKKIIISYHPSESRDKYDDILSKFSPKLEIIKSISQNILQSIARASLVIGMRSMALVVACLCNKKTISFIPDPNLDCPLPFNKILKIKRAEELDKQANFCII